jgi:chromosome segregation ATPase
MEARARTAELHAALPAAERSDREARARALAEGKDPPLGPGEKRRIEAELEETEQRANDLETAVQLVEQELGELRDSHRDTWTEKQGRAVEQAQQAVLEATGRLETAVQKLSDENALRGWIGEQGGQGSVDPLGGRLTRDAALSAALDQVRAAVAGLTADQEKPESTPIHFAHTARPDWGG